MRGGQRRSQVDDDCKLKGDAVAEQEDLAKSWPERLGRVKRSQQRTDLAGLTRPARDPEKQAALEELGQEGPFPPRDDDQPPSERP